MARCLQKAWRAGLLAGLLTGVLLLGGGVLLAQIIPSAPVKAFSLPRFGDHGYKIWELTGSRAEYVSDQRIDIADMVLTTYSGEEKLLIETTLVSPEAIVFMKRNQAKSTSTLDITGPGYRVQGRHWAWDGNHNTITIHEAVTVTFDERFSML